MKEKAKGKKQKAKGKSNLDGFAVFDARVTASHQNGSLFPHQRSCGIRDTQSPLPFAFCLLLFAFCLLPSFLFADAGVLIPAGRTQTDPSVLSLDEMTIDVLIDNGDARISVREIFASHQGGVLEGQYVFALPGGSLVSDFAVWDGVTRIPGVILERKRAEEIYQNLKWQAIDPGLLEMGERTAEEARRTAVFSARIVPIPPYGTKRLEMEYHQRIPVDDLKAFFAIPLKPDVYRNRAPGASPSTSSCARRMPCGILRR